MASSTFIQFLRIDIKWDGFIALVSGWNSSAAINVATAPGIFHLCGKIGGRFWTIGKLDMCQHLSGVSTK